MEDDAATPEIRIASIVKCFRSARPAPGALLPEKSRLEHDNATMPGWYLFQTGRGKAADNMAMDEALLQSAPELGRPVLRFYGWSEPAASFGYFHRYSDVEKLTPLRPLVRRPTGGGLVPHDKDWTYSLVFPPSHSWYALKATESYRRIHEWLGEAFAVCSVNTALSPGKVPGEIGQCFVGAEQFDLLHTGRKIAGAAQRRSRTGLLIQGSVQPPLELDRTQWEEAMCSVAARNWAVVWDDFASPQSIKELAQQLTIEKYSREQFNRKR